MSKLNSNLCRAKREKNDEFYTRYEDIEKEMAHYTDQLKNKWVYSPCDDYRWSNFAKYFTEHFEELGLKHYTCTNYDIGEGAFRYDYDGKNSIVTPLQGNGDYASPECTAIRDEADIIITNPPFSKFREFFSWIQEG